MPLSLTERAKQTEWVFGQIDEIAQGRAEGSNDLDNKLSQIMGVLKHYPLEYVMWNYPWATEKSIQMVDQATGEPILQEPYRSRFGCEFGPDKWACEFLDQLGDEIRERGFDGRRAVKPIRFTTSSGHGIGKSVCVAWLISFINDCYEWSMGVVTANTSDQLRTKTWAELAKWHRVAVTNHLWNYSNSRGSMSYSRKGDKAVAAKWRTDAMTARAENAEAFQGLHAANSVPFYIFDEASGIENEIWNARHGGGTDGMPMSFDFGNPTRKSGYFFENCIGQFKHRYIVRQIDSRSVAITNKALHQEWQDDWGEDSDLFKVKVRGVFPSAGTVQFIGTDSVEAATRRPALYTKHDPLILGVDCARYGENDTVIYPRIGDDARSFGWKRYNGLDGWQVADKVIELIKDFEKLGRRCQAIFIDGGGLGASPYDFLVRLGYAPIDVNFGKSASDTRYRYWGDEMWGRMRDALNNKLAIPFDLDLKAQLTQREYSAEKKINLESKKLMRERGVQSPDIADALALTYAQDVSSDMTFGLQRANSVMTNWDYDPQESRW